MYKVKLEVTLELELNSDDYPAEYDTAEKRVQAELDRLAEGAIGVEDLFFNSFRSASLLSVRAPRTEPRSIVMIDQHPQRAGRITIAQDEIRLRASETASEELLRTVAGHLDVLDNPVTLRGKIVQDPYSDGYLLALVSGTGKTIRKTASLELNADGAITHLEIVQPQRFGDVLPATLEESK